MPKCMSELKILVIYLIWIISTENPFTFNTFKCLKQDKTAGNHNKST